MQNPAVGLGFNCKFVTIWCAGLGVCTALALSSRLFLFLWLWGGWPQTFSVLESLSTKLTSRENKKNIGVFPIEVYKASLG